MCKFNFISFGCLTLRRQTPGYECSSYSKGTWNLFSEDLSATFCQWHYSKKLGVHRTFLYSSVLLGQWLLIIVLRRHLYLSALGQLTFSVVRSSAPLTICKSWTERARKCARERKWCRRGRVTEEKKRRREWGRGGESTEEKEREGESKRRGEK